MKPIKTLITLTITTLLASPALATVKEYISANNIETFFTDKFLIVTADIVLDSLDLKTNRQVVITPIVESKDSSQDSSQGSTTSQPNNSTTPQPHNSITLPSVLVNGRNMHISYERGLLSNFPALKNHVIWKELRRYNGTRQTVEYVAKVPLEPWMQEKGTRLSLRYDPCGCGVASAPEIFNVPIEEPVLPEELITNAIVAIPPINVPEVQIHAGKARIQFEVDRTALHVEPYTCRNGQRIDNRDELKVIDDSVKYALSDPNVELVGIDICGYASPESPYLHNVELADGRSMALADYLADHYRLPRENVTYSYVPENWGEFREMVLNSNEISELQRRRLLELIDAPATTPEEYDRKETLLKTDPRYANLYKNIILPDWFPKLRATTFALKTQLKDLDDEQLKQAFKTSPGKMSLQQLCRVANEYNSDSDEFNDVVLTALAKYPNDQIAIVNAAIGAMARGEYDRARSLLKDAEQTPEVFNMKALMAEAERDYAGAARFYQLAGDPEKAEMLRKKDERLKEILDSNN